MKRITRRHFLHSGLIAGGALAFDGVIARAALFESSRQPLHALQAPKGKGGYGPLAPAKTQNTGEALLALPSGFAYVVLGKVGSKMTDGHATPPRHDGMAAFKAGRHIHLVRNHEVNNGVGRAGAAFGDRDRAYDTMAGGGTTTLVIDPHSRAVLRDFASLSGTLQNCAGGPTPWGSWVTCEETVFGTTRLKVGEAERGGFAKNHGYCFEVPAASLSPTAAVPLKAMGRFIHEAIAVDPKTGIVYETEDSGTAGFYRFLPNRKGRLAEGGRLQMLAIKDRPDYDARTGQKVKQKLAVAWVEIADPDPPEADGDPLAVFKQGKARGGATFARLEGCWYGDGRIFFTATSGGDARLGQVWEFAPDGDGGTLRLLFESPSAELLDMPDNLCVSPRGGLVVCEDGRAGNFVRGLTRDGLIFDFARNIVPGFEGSEFAGATFSPDGQTLFVNAQGAGMTFAIWGPWKDGAL